MSNKLALHFSLIAALCERNIGASLHAFLLLMTSAESSAGTEVEADGY